MLGAGLTPAPKMRSQAARPALVSETRLFAPVPHNRLLFRDGIWTQMSVVPRLVAKILVCETRPLPARRVQAAAPAL